MRFVSEIGSSWTLEKGGQLAKGIVPNNGILGKGEYIIDVEGTHYFTANLDYKNEEYATSGYHYLGGNEHEFTWYSESNSTIGEIIITNTETSDVLYTESFSGGDSDDATFESRTFEIPTSISEWEVDIYAEENTQAHVLFQGEIVGSGESVSVTRRFSYPGSVSS